MEKIELVGRDSTIFWTLQNIGDIDITDLSVTLSDVTPAGQVTLSGFGTSLLAGSANAASGVITLNATQDSTVIGASATITVAGSFANSPCTFTFNYSLYPNCCEIAGDFNSDGLFNIADITAGIARIFASGAAPNCNTQADTNGDNTFNIADVTFGINRIFNSGPAPICGTNGS